MTWSHVVFLVSFVLLLIWLDEITKKLKAKKEKEREK